ncbi:calcium-binding protein [Synechococcus sp. CCY 0621]|uniref:calcium-binding protein n=1 Tax=Synechococcus sp. CCY 0621 TaxID=2815603 RepID=UPI001C24868C|nr:calcium-binding protein [Synechococcus sp. CCY 0621]
MTNLPSFTPSQLAFLESVLCPSAQLLALAGEPGGCDDSDQGEGDKPTPTLGTNKADLLDGGAGKDNLVGLNGDDTLRAFQGKDWLYGDNGNDFLDGGEGRDFLYGGNGDDELRGGKGRDDMYGENGNDLLIGGCGPDLMDGGRGDDVLFGGNSPDTYTGGLGRDVFVLGLPGGGGGHGGGGGIENLLAPMAEEEDEGDVVTDFRQGVDHLALTGGLTFGDLIFQGNAIYVVMEEAGAPVPLVTEDEHEGLGRLLATFTGFDTTQLGQTDFLTCADLSMG